MVERHQPQSTPLLTCVLTSNSYIATVSSAAGIDATSSLVIIGNKNEGTSKCDLLKMAPKRIVATTTPHSSVAGAERSKRKKEREKAAEAFVIPAHKIPIVILLLVVVLRLVFSSGRVAHAFSPPPFFPQLSGGNCDKHPHETFLSLGVVSKPPKQRKRQRRMLVRCLESNTNRDDDENHESDPTGETVGNMNEDPNRPSFLQHGTSRISSLANRGVNSLGQATSGLATRGVESVSQATSGLSNLAQQGTSQVKSVTQNAWNGIQSRVSQGTPPPTQQQMENENAMDVIYGPLPRRRRSINIIPSRLTNLVQRGQTDATNLVQRGQTGASNLVQWLDAQAKGGATAANTQAKSIVLAFTNKSDYQFGDITKEVLRRASSLDSSKVSDALLLLKILLTVGASITPLAKLLPLTLLLEMMNTTFASLGRVLGRTLCRSLFGGRIGRSGQAKFGARHSNLYREGRLSRGRY